MQHFPTTPTHIPKYRVLKGREFFIDCLYMVSCLNLHEISWSHDLCHIMLSFNNIMLLSRNMSYAHMSNNNVLSHHITEDWMMRAIIPHKSWWQKTAYTKSHAGVEKNMMEKVRLQVHKAISKVEDKISVMVDNIWSEKGLHHSY